jgi:hypothetical protein
MCRNGAMIDIAQDHALHLHDARPVRSRPRVQGRHRATGIRFEVYMKCAGPERESLAQPLHSRSDRELARRSGRALSENQRIRNRHVSLRLDTVDWLRNALDADEATRQSLDNKQGEAPSSKLSLRPSKDDSPTRNRTRETIDG